MPPARRGAPPGVRYVPPALYLVAILCFFLPFVTVSCASVQIAEVTGFDLLLNKDIETPPGLEDLVPGGTTPSDVSVQEIFRDDPRPFAIAAAAAAVLALGLAFVPRRPVRVTGLILGVATAALVFSLRFRFHMDVPSAEDLPQGTPDIFGGVNPITVTYGLGYWGAMLLALAAAGVQFWLVLRPPAGEGAAPAASALPTTAAPPPAPAPG